MSKLFKVMIAVGLIAVMLMALNGGLVWAANPPHPTYLTANVNGDTSEWNLTNDWFADMYRAADPDKEVESKLYLRYDCSSGTLYALVLAEPGVTIVANLPGDSFIKLGNSTKLVDGNSGDNGMPPDFAWVGLDGDIASGWEASAKLAVGSYTNLNVHTQVNDGGQQTSAVEDRAIDLVIDCNLGSIGDYVWHDVNLNGVQDSGEMGIANVTVKLYKSDDTLISTTWTNSSGFYIFTGLEPGDYYVQFVPPPDYDFSPQDKGTNDEVDSDADPDTGKTGIINLSAGETDLTWDAGLHLCIIGDRVWNDEDGQKDQDSTEPGFNGVAVYLYPMTATVTSTTCGTVPDYLAATTTISGTSQTPDGLPNGIYYFDMGTLGLPTGQYLVCVQESTLKPAGTWILTTGSNPRTVNYTGADDFSFDFGYVYAGPPTVVTLSSFAAKPSAGGAIRPLWVGMAGLTVLAAGSLCWAKRRTR
jgi:hypothetical protein